MDLGIAGRKAIVCASSKGLGRACAMALAREACAVIVNGRDAAIPEATAREIRESTDAEVVAVADDLDSPEVRAALLEVCPAPDILVDNNGDPPPAPLGELTRERILRGAESNTLTPIAPIRRVAPGMAQRRFGRIVDSASSPVRAPIAGHDASSGVRAGLTALAKDNMTINSTQPGAFETDRIRSALNKAAAASGGDPTALCAKREATILAGRFGAAEELGALCAYLASAGAGYIAGQNIFIDGGAFPGAF